MAARPDVATRRVRVVALLLIAGLVAGPLSTHVYWLLGGRWGLSTEGLSDEMASTGVRVVAGVVVVLLLAAMLVVLARVGLWRQRFVSVRTIRMFAWALAGVFFLETLASFTWGLTLERWLYGPVSLVLGAPALVVARSGSGSTRSHQTLPPHK